MKTTSNQTSRRRLPSSLLCSLALTACSPFLEAQPAPHNSCGIQALPDGTMMLNLGGSVSGLFPNLPIAVSNQFRQMYDLYVIEASTNLADWTRLALLPRTNSDLNPVSFQDTNAPGFTHRFYRTFTNHLVTGFPKPTGPYEVGTFSRVLTDPSRTNRYGIATNSSFMSTFWYPGDPPAAGCLPGPYTDRAVAADQSFYTFWGFPYQWTSAAPSFVTHSVPDLPLAAGTNRFPVIVHSHGWTCDRRFNSHIAEELASHGYIVAAVDHEDSHATVFPDSRGPRYVPPGSLSSVALFWSRVKDIQWLLDELVSMDTGDPLLGGRLDLNALGMMGFSLGGCVAAETGRSETRLKCAALLDAYIDFSVLPELNSQGLQKPFLTMNRTLPFPGFSDFSPMSQHLFGLARSNATWLKATNTDHFAFSDWAWSTDLTAASRAGALAMDACLVWFFDTYLKGQNPPFPARPELINVQRK